MSDTKYQGNYTCECGRNFTNSQSFNGHKSHCKVHLGESGWAKHQVRMQNYINAGQVAAKQIQENAKVQKQIDLALWITEQHCCEYCGKVMTAYYGSGRFCSQECARGYSGKIANERPPILQQNYCLNCAKEIDSTKKYCCKECATEAVKIRHYQEYLADNSIAWGYKNMHNYKKYFLEEQQHKCAICGNLDTWQGKVLVFILDHIDGNADNNNRDNLRLVCPNCDSQLDTFKSKNKNSARAKYRNIKVVTVHDDL